MKDIMIRVGIRLVVVGIVYAAIDYSNRQERKNQLRYKPYR